MRKLHGIRNKENLHHVSTTYFIGSKNEIRYYTDNTTGRNYAEGCFEWIECVQDFMYKEWFLLGKNDIKNDDAYCETEEQISRHFGIFFVKRNLCEPFLCRD